MRLPVFPNWFPFNDMLLDGHLQVGEHGVKTRSYDWKYRGPVLLYNSGRTAHHCVRAYDYTNSPEHHRVIVGIGYLEDVRPLTEMEWLKMRCNFNNLTPRQVKAEPWRLLVNPYPFGYFFTHIERFKKPILFNWPPGPVKPIFTEINPGSALHRLLRTTSACQAMSNIVLPNVVKNIKRTMGWKTTQPPKRMTRPIKLRYQDGGGKIHQGEFFWSNSERTWVQCEDPEGIGLYEQDGYKVVGWK